MRSIAIIPARSGSKGLPDKNIKPLNGKPLLAYSIEAALASGMFDTVHVSTDSERYAGIARHLQGLVWLGQQETAAQTADPADRAGARALFARSKGTKHPDLSISDKTGPR